LDNIVDLRSKFYAIRVCKCLKEGDEEGIVNILESVPPELLASIYYEIEIITGKRILSLCN